MAATLRDRPVNSLPSNPDRGSVLRWVPRLTLAILIGPVVAGLLGTLLPAFGYFPALGGTDFGMQPWRELIAAPGLAKSVALSLTTGFLTTALSLAIAVALCASWQGSRWFCQMEKLLAPLLAIPHVAAAFGIAFMMAPSGWIVRLFSPWATGFRQPPDWLTVNDPFGLGLVFGLAAKEVPFLLLLILSASGQAEVARGREVAATLGYGPIRAWLTAVFPRIYPQIRLPVLAVLTYGVSVVDVAMVLGPTNPEPLAVRLVRLFNDPDLSLRFVASAGACVQCVLAAGGAALWLAGETAVRRAGVRWIVSGTRWQKDGVARLAAAAVSGVLVATLLAGIVCTGLWAFASAWRFPDVWPERLAATMWARHAGDLWTPLFNTMRFGLVTAAFTVVLVIGWLENEARSGHADRTGASWLPYLPLLLPQVAFLFGVQLLLVSVRLDGHWLAVAWLHFVFAFPYVFLSLADSYRAWDSRYGRTASCLGAGPANVFFRIKLPMLMRPVVNAATLGFAVSVGLYLPTLLCGGGRHPSITTEAVALSSSNDARVIGVYAVLQMLLPLVVFLAGTGWVTWRFRERKGMAVA
jgi:putative thiamine transport system permease protein